ncbi:class A beta-lactamase-related serine hydrolase [Paenibacillus pinisoli]|uniref:Class A beta-lactamase-related serine hydrolase n=1 Tax=Paenibacillus pinisoli TaxID=1276110 RepID=A0A3A6PFU5_9BACL|nr:serine hydrolase domain-containing protein [Paenibacillus pinisoli]RJX39080.1 class A beta-lactamase-related serine hydrolase [Paenibacillus pinisoli]
MTSQTELASSNNPELSQRLNDIFRKYEQKQIGVPKGRKTEIQGRIYSASSGIDYRFPNSPKPYHAASVGKLFTMTMAGMLADQGLIGLGDRIASYFEKEELEQLFLHRGRDYAYEVTVSQLLNHTSGVGDYFEGPVTSGRRFPHSIFSEPNRIWTPQELVAFTRERQRAFGPPGEQFRYSDTGYILLGQLMEKATGSSYGSLLRKHIFEPLELRDTYLMFYTEPMNAPAPPISPLWFKGRDLSRLDSLSCDWSGGGIVSTTDDLIAFSKALHNGELIAPSTLQQAASFPYRFRPGIYYGLGMMEIRFERLFFLLRGYPRLRGHLGITAAHLHYDPASDTHIALNFGSDAAMNASFRALVAVLNELKKVQIK